MPVYTLPTPVRVDQLNKWLDGYPKQAQIVDIFQQGAYLDFKGIECPLTSNNSHTAKQRSDIVTLKIQEELSLHRIAGPFDSPPFTHFKISPLALREKQETGKYRLLHNLSFPYDDTSVNHNIPKSSTNVQYESMADAIQNIQNCSPGAYMAKSDIANAFRIVPLHPSQYHLTGFSWEQQYYYDKCLPQGCSSSCKIFEAVSTALKWIMNHKLGTANIVKVLDDFLFVAESEQECAYALRKFIFLCEELGIPLAMNKTTGPTQILTFLGIELDTLLMTARLPADKLQKYRNTIISLMAQSKVTLRELKSIIGMLQFATTVVTPGRPFLRRLYDLTIHANKPHYYIRLNKQTKDDLLMWISFLHTYNGKTLIYSPTIADSSTVHFYSDASKSAFGATYGSYWIQGKWPTDWQREDITVLELYPIFLAINIFKLKLTNAHIVFHCDNTAVVTIINKQTSKHKGVMHIIRPMVLTLLTHNVTFQAQHIPGVENRLCDSISRLRVTAEMLRHYGMQGQPTHIPEHLEPRNFKLR